MQKHEMLLETFRNAHLQLILQLNAFYLLHVFLLHSETTVEFFLLQNQMTELKLE
ncbi:unnamed protein product [Schistosoma curassoni]|uniref:Uncharacterized protein n=1 Tax=Schistosoma curassoni TaxID=6186 RepID=A0A183KKM7_9TREM|nr:unnamed protein product [Schistosoma curassoni]